MKENKLINKKGFTLIELLAVIVILALIALIATPIVLNIISDSKQKAKNDSVNGIIDATKLYYAQNQDMELPATITFDNEGVARIGTTIVNLGISGEKPTGGEILIDSQGNILAQGLTFSDGYICTMASGEDGCVLAGEGNVTNNPAITYITSKNTNTSLTDDPNEPGTRRIFKGATPNNYINIKENNVDVPYRIVSIESDGAIKVVRDETEDTYRPWDETDRVGRTDMTGPRLNENNTYCQLVDCIDVGLLYLGCNAWGAVDGTFTNGEDIGTVTDNASLNTYLNDEFYDKLDNNVKSKILTYSFDIGGIYPLSSLPSAITQAKAHSWQGKIGLINYMDWFSASSYASCDSSKGNNDCSNENYLHIRDGWWIISPSADDPSSVHKIISDGWCGTSNACYSGGVRPAFYLTSNINLTGEGTSTHPFEIS